MEMLRRASGDILQHVGGEGANAQALVMGELMQLEMLLAGHSDHYRLLNCGQRFHILERCYGKDIERCNSIICVSGVGIRVATGNSKSRADYLLCVVSGFNLLTTNISRLFTKLGKHPPGCLDLPANLG